MYLSYNVIRLHLGRSPEKGGLDLPIGVAQMARRVEKQNPQPIWKIVLPSVFPAGQVERGCWT